MSAETSRIFLVPEDIQKEHSIVKLKHPRTNSVVLCALSESNELHEIVHFENELSSWFIDDSVIEDGRLFMLTNVDPLFFILPYANQNAKFCPLEDLLVDENYPDAFKLSHCCSLEQLQNIFNFKELSGLMFFSYNKSKTLHWLQEKVKNLCCALKEENVNLSDGSKASILICKEDYSEEKLLEYSCHLLSEYLNTELSKELFSCLGLKQKSEDNKNETKSKKQNTAISPTDDYSKKFSMKMPENKQKKLTPAQKRLMKTDITGMKTLSFFKKK